MLEVGMRQKDKVWTPATIELLKKLWEEGLSAAQISSQIPGSTRNSIIGKRHRLGLPTHKQAPSQNPARIRARKERMMPVFKEQIVLSPPEAPQGEGIPFMKANSTTCRSVEGYEVNSKGHSLALFCSNRKDIEASFCAFHQNIYYRKVER